MFLHVQVNAEDESMRSDIKSYERSLLEAAENLIKAIQIFQHQKAESDTLIKAQTAPIDR